MDILTQTANLSVLSGDNFQYSFQVRKADGTLFSLDGCLVDGVISFSGSTFQLSANSGNVFIDKYLSTISLFIPGYETAEFPLGVATYSIRIIRQYESAIVFSGNFSVIDSAYPLVANTAWDDLRISGSEFKATGGIKAPDFSLFINDGGSSHGIYLYWFDPATVEDVFFNIQMPHNWKEGTSVYPHVHFVPKTTGASNAFVVWGLEYTIANIGGSFGASSLVYIDASTAAGATVQGDAILSSGKHYISAFPALTMTGKTISAMFLGRLFRAVSDTYDTYGYDAGALEFDLHYEIDGFGSKDQFAR